jgi:hypothetical protein
MTVLKVVLGVLIFLVVLEAASLSQGRSGSIVEQIKRDLHLD